MTAVAVPSGYTVLPLKPFQREGSDEILGVFRDTAGKIEADPAKRSATALAQGVVLLRSPTGSGKTLTMGRTLERTIGAFPRRTVWFWFAPYGGLVAQTSEALKGQCPGLRIRDLKADRDAAKARDGDVFISTWASVASAKKEAKVARRDDDDAVSVDLTIAALRADGWYIGAVIDEAHANFGGSAKQAADFYLKILRPDFTMLATATPKDRPLEEFEKATGMRVNRVEVSREVVVHSCLNKVGVKAVHFRPDLRDENLLDMEEVAIYAGLVRHRMVKRALAEAGVDLVPLFMIQVDNETRGERDPVEKVKEFLKAQSVNMDTVAVHTSGEPDPAFHTLAYDEQKEILIFKVAAATGFDAPRAWTLVSMRRSIGVEFGLQVLGRIMRVHHKVQHLHPFATTPMRSTSNILDFGYVFMANPEEQVGITAAAATLKSIHDTIETVTDNVVVIDFGGRKAVLLDPDGGFAELLDPPPPLPSAETNAVSEDVTDGGDVEDATLPSPTRAAALASQSWLDMALPEMLRGALEEPHAPSLTLALTEETSTVRPGIVGYRLRTDIVFPRALAREVMPKSMDGLVKAIAQRIKIDDGVLSLVTRTRGKVIVTEEDVFGTSRTTGRENVPLSNLRIAQQAQMAFRFNDSIDDRDLKPALLERLRHEINERGHEVADEKDLRRAVDLLAMARPELLHDACRSCLSGMVEIRQDEEIPAFYQSAETLETAEKNVYGVFPAGMNREELAFAQMLDADQTGTVLWWLRNAENTSWAVTIVLPNGRRHFPDFVIGVDGRRKSRDHIALVEVKDDGRTGRLFSTANTDKVRTEHSLYRSALMVFRDERGQWVNVAYNPAIQRHVASKSFDIEDLVWTQ